MRKMILVVVLLLFQSFSVFTEEKKEEEVPSPPSITIMKIIAENPKFPTVDIEVNVVDEKDVPIIDLKSDDFTINDGKQFTGSEITLTPIEPEGMTAYVLLIDVSGSMKEEGRIDKAKDACAYFIDHLSGNDQLALMTFSDEIKQYGGFTSDKEELKKRLSAITEVGKETRLYDAIHKASIILNKIKEAENKVMVVLTDGKDSNEPGESGKGSALIFDQCIFEAKMSNIPIYSIGIGRGADKPHLERFAEITNAKYYYSPTADELKDIFKEITVLRMKGDYSLTYTIPNSYLTGVKEGDERKVDVQVKYKGVPNVTRGTYKVPEFKLPTEVKKCPWLIIGVVAGFILLMIIIILSVRRRPRRRPFREEEPRPGKGDVEELEERVPELKKGEVGTGFNLGDYETGGKRPIRGDVEPETVTAGVADDRKIEEYLEEGKTIAYLRVVGVPESKTSLKGHLYEMTKEKMAIGRASDRDIILQGDDYISRVHAEVRYDQRHFVVEDMGSTNGTFIYRPKKDDEFVKVGRAELKPGYLIGVGRSYVLRLELPKEVVGKGGTRVM